MRASTRWVVWPQIVLSLLLAFYPRSARADDFTRLVGPSLFDIPQERKSGGVDHLTVAEIESLPEVLRGERSALIVATTDQGNVAKLLVSQALQRKSMAKGEDDLEPVLVLDRFETIDAGDRQARKSHGRTVVLFDGFQFDLDVGRVVPPGFGGDIRFVKDGHRLTALGKNRLYPIEKPPALPGRGPGQPSTGAAVLPTDFNGRYLLVANGQISGALELEVADDGKVSGRFRSDRNGAVYPLAGEVAADMARRVAFEITFPRSKQQYEGLLWTEDRNVFAGTVQIQGHPYSFIAVREGASLVPEAIEAASPPRTPSAIKKSERVLVIEAPDRFTLDGVAKTGEELTAALKKESESGEPVMVLIRAPESMPYVAIERTLQLLQGAGIKRVHFEAMKEP